MGNLAILSYTYTFVYVGLSPAVSYDFLARRNASFSDILTRSAKLSLHFLHNLAAMNFNHDLANAQFGSDLFIEHARNDPFHSSCSRGVNEL